MINQEIIRRYLHGEADGKDLKLLKAYFKGNDLSLLGQFMKQDWSEAEEWEKDQVSPALSAEMLKHIKQELTAAKTARLRPKSNRRVWAAAAAALLVLAAGLWFLLDGLNTTSVYATGFGEWMTVQLPDGSNVKLNANSKLKSPKIWEDGTDRQVWLEGEAFFQVEKKPATGAKFRVITKDLEVEVLGTSFNVSSRGSQTDVYLEEGQIRLSMGDQEEMLKPGDFIAYSTEKKDIVERRRESTPEPHTSWKDGVLVLRDKSIAEILNKMEEIYGVDVQVTDENLLKRTKTIAVPMDRLEVALPVLEGLLEKKITKQGEKLLIR